MQNDPAGSASPLSDESARWRHLLEASGEGYWDVDRGAGQVFFSPKIRELLWPDPTIGVVDAEGGWRMTTTEFSHSGLVHPDDMPRLIETMDRSAGVGILELHQEFRMRQAGGDFFWVVSRGRIMEADADGRPRRVCGWLSPVVRSGDAEAALLAVLDTVSSLTGKQYFERLAVRLSEALHMRYCLVSELQPGPVPRVRSIAYAVDGRVSTDVDYDLAGTPCEEVVNKGLCVFPSGVARLFPADSMLTQMSVESYLGLALRSSSGETLGLLSVLGTEPMQATGYSAALFEHFGARASAELDRLRAEREKLHSERQYRQLFQKMPAGFGLFDAFTDAATGEPMLRWVQCNPVMEAMLRVPLQEVLGRTLLEVLPHFDRTTYGILLNVVETGEERQTIHYSTRHQATLELSAFRPSPGQLAVLAQDLTQRMEAEGALRESERRFRELLESANVAALILDCDGRIQFCNEYLAKLLGCGREEITGLDWYQEFVPEAVRRVTRARLEGVLHGAEGARTGRNEVQCRDGKRRLFEWDNTPLFDARGEPTGVAAIGRDLTDRLALEEQYRQSQKLEAVGRLAGGVAHDFNNLLTVISGYSRLALANAPAGDTVLPRYLQEVVKASERAAERTRQLLAFGRRQVMRSRPVGLHSLVKGLEPMLVELVGDDIQLALDLRAAHDVTLADPGQMEQVLLNLALNARDAMPSGGRITLATRNETFAKAPAGSANKLEPGEYILLRVSDSGNGMNEEVLGHLFEPFFTTKGLGEGSGLGLSTAYGIVGQSGGDIRVSSEVGRGSCFDVYLPCAEDDQGDGVMPESLESKLPVGGGQSVLIAEDQEEVLAFASEVLRGLGYRVTEACNAEQALHKAEAQDWKVDLLLTDLMMPGADGGTLARELRASIPALKVVFMSGYSDPDSSGASVKGTGGRYLRKPFSPEELACTVREELGPGGCRVLVADDEAAVRLYMRSVLEDAGYVVREAADGRAAMRELEAEPADVLITDLVMPDQEGIETIRLARKAFPQLRIIAISGAFFGQFLKMAELLGANAVLPKPLSQAAMLDTVRDVLGRPPE
ncbi:response regulator [Paludibaculum fermentans]|uniref:response regulator n=1 Tax=Paludibaculum fermentans TaxID=1473598 RepID=UPI003EC00C67